MIAGILRGEEALRTRILIALAWLSGHRAAKRRKA